MCLCNCVNTNCVLKNRKDSFITHRAFCDALTQENSRIGSFPIMSNAPNLNFRHNLMMMNNGGDCGIPFPGMYGGGMIEPNLDANSLKPRAPIWLEQNGSESNINSSFLGSSSYNNNIGEMLPSEMMQWMNRNHESMAATYSGLHLKEEEDSKGEMFNDMYDSYTTSTAHMSATALLQKAAQMGSTRSTNNGDTNTNAFGLMTTSPLDSLNYDNGDNANSLMMMMNSTNTKQLKGNNRLNEPHDSDLTRDFLGAGRSFNMQQGLFKFTSSMDHQ